MLASYNVDHLFADIIAFRESSPVQFQLTNAQEIYYAAALTHHAPQPSREETFAASMAIYETSRRKPKRKKKKNKAKQAGSANAIESSGSTPPIQ